MKGKLIGIIAIALFILAGILWLNEPPSDPMKWTAYAIEKIESSEKKIVALEAQFNKDSYIVEMAQYAIDHNRMDDILFKRYQAERNLFKEVSAKYKEELSRLRQVINSPEIDIKEKRAEFNRVMNMTNGYNDTKSQLAKNIGCILLY